MNLKIFFWISTAVLLIIAAGLAVNAASELEEYTYKQVINHNVEGNLIHGRYNQEATTMRTYLQKKQVDTKRYPNLLPYSGTLLIAAMRKRMDSLPLWAL